MDDLLLIRELKDAGGLVCDYEKEYSQDLFTKVRPGLICT